MAEKASDLATLMMPSLEHLVQLTSWDARLTPEWLVPRCSLIGHHCSYFLSELYKNNFIGSVDYFLSNALSFI